MDIKKPLLITACSLGASSMALGAAQTQSDNKSSDANVKIQIPEKAIKSGKIIIKDGQVYVRVGTETKMDSGDGKAIILETKHPQGNICSYYNC